jgi:hypothetical protein
MSEPFEANRHVWLFRSVIFGIVAIAIVIAIFCLLGRRYR